MNANQLRADILSRWGSTGDWNQGGVDRALELARLFEANGITDLSGLRLGNTTEHFDDATTWQGGDAGFEQVTPAHDVRRQQLLAGDRALGFLGDSNNDNTLGRIGERQYLGDNGTLGWSAQGHGNVSFNAMQGPDGQLQVQPVWGSSSDAGDARQAAMAIAAMVAMAYGIPAMTGAEGAAVGAAEAGGGIAGGSGLTLGGSAGYGSIGAASGLGGTGAGLSITPGMAAAFTTPELAALGAAGTGSVLSASGGAGGGSGAAANGASGASNAGLSSADRAALLSNSGYGPGMTGAQTTAFDTVSGLTGSNSLGASVANAVGGDWTGALQSLGGSMDWTDLARLGLAAYGASQSRDGSTTQSRDPWGPAQPFLLNQLNTGAQLQQQLQQQPFNAVQQQAMQQKLGLLNGLNGQAMPGLLSGLNTMQQGYQRPGGPAARAPAFNFGGQGLLASMQSTPIDFAAMNPYRRG
jgi:hypothetical protein